MHATSAVTAEAPPTYGALVKLFIPLSLSDMIMVISGPIIAAVLGRLPEVTIQLAAYGVAMSLGLFVECPITMMLHAGTAAAGRPTTYRNLGKLLWFWNILITLVHGLVAFTPLFGWVTDSLLGLPPDVAGAARWAFAVNLFSSIWVGHRRYMQGQLIHHRRSRWILIAGFSRLGTLTGVLVGAAALGVPGAVAAGLAGTCATFAEMVAVSGFVRRLRRELASGQAAPPERGHRAEIPEEFSPLFRWYLPLVGTQFLVVAVPPLLTAGIARAGLPALSLAAWPLAWSTVRLLGNGTRMMQQITISMSRDSESYRRIRNFAVGVGLAFSALLAAVAFTPLAPFYLVKVIGLRGELVEVTRPVLMIATLLPLQISLQNWFQGLLVRRGRTVQVNAAAFVGGAVTLTGLFAGALLWGLPGAPLAAGASIFGQAVELLVLFGFTAGVRREFSELS